MTQSRDRLKRTAKTVEYRSQLPAVSRLERQASITQEASMGFGGMGGSVVRVNPKPYSPIYDESYLMMPRDRREMNAWVRHFYETDPIIRNAIDLHTHYPLSKFDIRCPWPRIKSFFEEMIHNINLHEVILGIGQEYWKIGEVFPEAELDTHKGVWTNIYIHNPDYIDVKDMIFLQEPLIMMIPDDETKRIIQSPSQDEHLLREQIPPEVVQYVMMGQNIPLNNVNISYIVRKSAPYNKRGSSILTCLFKDLMLRDKYREAQYVIADDHVTPLKVFKIGNDKIRPTGADLEAFRNTLAEAVYDPNFTLVYHDGLTVEYVGSNGVVLDLSSEYERIERMIYTGLFTSQAIANGEGPTYSQTEVALDILQQRYLAFRQQIEHWIERKIFRPISEMNDFYEFDPQTNEKKLIVPQISWQRINLKNNKDYIETLLGLAEKKMCSYTRIFEMLDLDFREEQNLVTEERKIIAKTEEELKAITGESGESTESDSGSLDLGDTGDLDTGTTESAPASTDLEMPPLE